MGHTQAGNSNTSRIEGGRACARKKLGLIAASLLSVIYLVWLVWPSAGAYQSDARASSQPAALATERSKDATHQKGNSTAMALIPKKYVGKYEGEYFANDGMDEPWVGEVHFEVDECGSVSGYMWLPTNDGGPGLVCTVTGRVDSSGRIAVRSDHGAAGSHTGRVNGPGIDAFQFSQNGAIRMVYGKMVLAAAGKGNQGYPENMRADRIYP